MVEDVVDGAVDVSLSDAFGMFCEVVVMIMRGWLRLLSDAFRL